MRLLDPRGKLSGLEWSLLAALAALIIAFSVVTVIRSAYGQRRMTDAGVYFRAGWAIRAGVDPYSVKDDNDWTFLYPPPVAIMLAPLADPPAGEPRPFMFSYGTSVILWLILSWVCMGVAAHWLAKAYELTAPDPSQRSWSPFTRRWVQNRLYPFLLCLIPVGAAISRGQINFILIMLLAGMILSVARGKRFSAGMWLAAAACLKVFPGFLILYPLFRRDLRQLSGFAVGCFLLMIVVPVVTVGPTKAYDLNYRFFDTMVRAQLAKGEDQAKQVELAGAIDNQSIMAVSYNTRNLDAIRKVAMIKPDATDKAIHLVAAVLLTLITLGAVIKAERGRQDRVRSGIMLIGLLTCVMIAISPVAHMHYFMMAMPLIAAMWLPAKERGGPTLQGWVAAVLYVAANVIPHIQPVFRDLMFLGLAQWTNLVLWGVGIWVLARTKPDSPAIIAKPSSPVTT